jgi:hypothetical protein
MRNLPYMLCKHDRTYLLLPPCIRKVQANVSWYLKHSLSNKGAWGGIEVKALRYWSDGPRIDSRGVTGFFSDIFLLTATWTWG